MNPADLAGDPRWHPYGLDWKTGRLLFLPTEAARLRTVSFIDGREDFSTGPGMAVPLEQALDSLEAGSEPDRFIFHVSYCGSTLLANLLDQPGRVLALKEPNLLVDLSLWRAEQLAAGCDDPRYRRTLALALRLLRRPFAPGERIVIKPSNWANNLIGDVIALAGPRMVFIGMDRRQFVSVVFRGNRDRAVYTTRALSHLVSGDGEWQAHLGAAIEAPGGPLDRMARLALLAHRLQTTLFEQALALAHLDRAEAMLDFGDIVDRPAEAAAKAATQLDIPMPAIRPDVLARDVKSPGRTYSPAEHRHYDEAIERHHGGRFDAAIEWIDSRFG